MPKVDYRQIISNIYHLNKKTSKILFQKKEPILLK